MRKVGVLAAVVLAGLVVAGVVFLPRGESVRLVPRAASGGGVRAHWEAELARGARERPSLRFDNLSEQEFRRRLDRAAERYHFTIESVELLRPKQLAPMVVVRSSDPFALSRDVPAIARSLDPKAATDDDRTGWAWEGFYFEVHDQADKPAIVVFNYWRQNSGGGGQWAADESLYPFPHG
jgi:hypothetical protein